MATQRDPNRAPSTPNSVAEQLKEEGRQRLTQGKAAAADRVNFVANALKRAGRELNRNQPLLGAYANQVADAVGRLSSRLRETSIDELVSDAQAAARRNPVLFVAGGLALGVILGRVIRAVRSNDEPVLLGTEYEELDVDPARTARRANGDRSS